MTSGMENGVRARVIGDTAAVISPQIEADRLLRLPISQTTTEENTFL